MYISVSDMYCHMSGWGYIKHGHLLCSGVPTAGVVRRLLGRDLLR